MRWRLTAVAGLLALWGGVARGGTNLEITEVIAPATAKWGESIDVDNTVENTGSVDIVDSFYVGIYLSTNTNINRGGDTFLGRRFVSGGLTVGANSQDVTRVTIPPTVNTGDYYIGAYADNDDDVVEGQENDNDTVDLNGIHIEGRPTTPFGGGCSPGCESAAWLVPLAFSLAGLRRRRRARG